MVETLEQTALSMTKKDIKNAKTIGIRGAQEYPVAKDYKKAGNAGLRVYSCDADCDSCHCATY